MKKDFIPANLRVFLTPTITILVLIVLTILVVKIGLPLITKQNSALSTASANEQILTQKEGLLRDVSATVTKDAESITLALPEKNPALVTISQIKSLATSKGVLIKNLKVGSGAEEQNFSRVEVAFDADGSLANVMDFLNSIKTISPISVVEKVKISQSGGILSATTSLRGFWASFPATLPAITDPVTNLSDDEKNLIVKLSDLTPPAFSSVAPGEPSTRDNPF